MKMECPNSPIPVNDEFSNDGEEDALKKNEGRKKIREFEDILDAVGSSGKYQKFLLYGFVCPMSVLLPFMVLNIVFMLSEPDHWCLVPGREEKNVSIAMWKNLTLPLESGADGKDRFSRCKMFESETNAVTECSVWEYDQSDYKKTIPTEFNWVCSKEDYAAKAFTIFSVGSAVGAIVFGWIGDKFGRKLVFISTVLMNLIFRTASLYVPGYYGAFLSMQFLVGTSFPMIYISAFAIMAEICGKDLRAWIYALSWIFWVGGICAIPLIAYLTADWFVFGLISLLPALLVCIYFKYLPESPRWLLQAGKLKDAEKILTQIAITNGNKDKFQNGEIQRMLIELKSRQKEQSGGVKKQEGVWTLFTKRRVAVRTVLLSIVWSMNGIVYYGITLNTTSMAGNQFLNFFYLSIIELPTGWLGGYLVERVGRRWTQVVFFLSCTLGFILAAIGDSYSTNLVVIVAVMIAKFSVAITSFVVTLQAVEIFPTELRSNGSGFASTIGSCGSILAPYTVYLGKYNSIIPYLAMALFSFIGVVSSSILPETLGQSLPETMEDANNLGKNAKFWSYLPKDYKPPRRKSSIWAVLDLGKSI